MSHNYKMIRQALLILCIQISILKSTIFTSFILNQIILFGGTLRMFCFILKYPQLFITKVCKHGFHTCNFVLLIISANMRWFNQRTIWSHPTGAVFHSLHSALLKILQCGIEPVNVSHLLKWDGGTVRNADINHVNMCSSMEYSQLNN